MIKINRPKEPKIDIYTKKTESLSAEVRANLLKLIDKNSVHFKSFIPRLKDTQEMFSKAEEETLLAINYYADPNNFENSIKKTTEKAPKFDVYTDKELKDNIRKLFNKKCAYCDNHFLANSNADIEHFRPKSAFNPFKNAEDQKLIKPGYYWLGADWDNLLWSCILCNRKNKLDQPNVEGLHLFGKKNRFPITDENLRIRSHNEDLKKEEDILLIINPCIDDPEDHFEFLITGHKDNLGIVRSKNLQNGQPNIKAETSIPLYGLNRSELVFHRKRVAARLKGNFIALVRSVESFKEKKKNGENTDEAREEFLLQKSIFIDEYDKASNFLSMKKTLLEEFKKHPVLLRLGLKVENLLK